MTESVDWPADGALAALGDGSYTFGLRPHLVQPARRAAAHADWVPIEGRVSIAEISGSESVVHFDMQGQTWVSQSHGVHGFAVGENAAFRLDVARGLYFAPDGRCVAIAAA